MKSALIIYFLPLVFALTTIYFISDYDELNRIFYGRNNISKIEINNSNYIGSFDNTDYYEEIFLKSGKSSDIIYLLGSSELTGSTALKPYNFISSHFNTPVYSIGHAGNQCFSIFSQLFANKERLNETPIVIILSPGWFADKSALGTSSESFLEFNSERFLKKILNNTDDEYFKNYESKRINQLYSDFNSPNLEIKILNFEHLASKSIIHKLCYTPLIYCDRYLLKLKDKINQSKQLNNSEYIRRPIIPSQVIINWDSIYSTSRTTVLKASNNNSFGIENIIFTNNIRNKFGFISPVDEHNNTELYDFKILIDFLKKKNVKASFIISPLNALYIKNLGEFLPTMKIIEDEINKSGFPYLNLMELEKTKYDKALLFDVMHLSDFGWSKVNNFIINTYNLNK